MTRSFAGLALTAILTAATAADIGCGRDGTAEGAAQAEAPVAKKVEGVVIDPAMLASITIAVVTEQPVTRVMSVAGRVQFDEDRIVRIIPPISGHVVNLRVKVGDRVRAGDTICSINSREAINAVSEYIESRTDLDLAEKQAALTRDLYEHDAASRLALRQSENDLGKAQARFVRTGEALKVLGLSAEIDVTRFNGRLPIISPIDGAVVERKVTEGQFVQPDPTPMVTVASLDTVWVMGDVFERDLRFVSRGQSAVVTAAAYPGESFRGRVDYITDSIDPATRTAKVRVVVANPSGRLKPEMFVAISLDVADDARAIVLPASAVFSEQGRTFVYTDAGAGRFVRRAIEVADDNGGRRRVVGGLKVGERVVIDGVLLVRQEEQQAG